LKPIEETPAYKAFLEEIRSTELPKHDPTAHPLCAVRDGVLGGNKKKRCWLTRKLIAPGDPIVRMRRLFDHDSHDDFDIVDKATFKASPWVRARAIREQSDSARRLVSRATPPFQVMEGSGDCRISL